MEKIKNIVKSSIAPTDRNALWLNTEDGVLYAFSVSGSNQGWVPSGSGGIEEVTYDQLVALRNSASLVPGKQYRIIDYVTQIKEGHTITLSDHIDSIFVGDSFPVMSAEHPFDVIVTAISETQLSENAKAAEHVASDEKTLVDVQYVILDMVGKGYIIFKRFPQEDYGWSHGIGQETIWNYAYIFKGIGDDLSEITWVPDDIYDSADLLYTTIPFEDLVIGEPFLEESAEFLVHEKGTVAVEEDSVEYFQHANFGAWELKYCLDNDINRFDWAKPAVEIPSDTDRAILQFENLKSGAIWTKYIKRNPYYDDTNPHSVLWSEVTGIDFGTRLEDISEEDWQSYPTSPIYTQDWYWFISDDTLLEVGNYTEYTISYNPRTGSTYGRCTISAVMNGKPKGIIPGGKGVIYYMKDEFGNECSYDFKNIKISTYPDLHDPEFYYTFDYRGMYDDGGGDSPKSDEPGNTRDTKSKRKPKKWEQAFEKEQESDTKVLEEEPVEETRGETKGEPKEGDGGLVPSGPGSGSEPLPISSDPRPANGENEDALFTDSSLWGESYNNIILSSRFYYPQQEPAYFNTMSLPYRDEIPLTVCQNVNAPGSSPIKLEAGSNVWFEEGNDGEIVINASDTKYYGGNGIYIDSDYNTINIHESVVTTMYLTQAQYDALVNSGQTNYSTLYIITDAN